MPDTRELDIQYLYSFMPGAPVVPYDDITEVYRWDMVRSNEHYKFCAAIVDTIHESLKRGYVPLSPKKK
jgi:hypothetical protein